MKTIKLKCEDDRHCYDQSIRTIAVTRETDRSWFGLRKQASAQAVAR